MISEICICYGHRDDNKKGQNVPSIENSIMIGSVLPVKLRAPPVELVQLTGLLAPQVEDDHPIKV
jgi:hypothetical protein